LKLSTELIVSLIIKKYLICTPKSPINQERVRLRKSAGDNFILIYGDYLLVNTNISFYMLQVLKTHTNVSATLNPKWNEDLLFVVAKPFEEQLVLHVGDHVSSRKDDLLGRVTLPLTMLQKRLDHLPFVQSCWFDLEKFGIPALEGETN
jgi:C2 domain